MAFGPLIDTPLLLVPFVLIVKYKNFFVNLIVKIRIPKIILALLVSVPLIIFEEHINCGAYGCANVFIPPTIWFCLIVVLISLFLVRIIRIKKITSQIIFLGALGALWELFLGVARVEFQQLLAKNPIVFIFMIFWVGLSYAFILFLPLLIYNRSNILRNQ